eukprot:m.278664 g.278664  ORF g.278664 m.278664 type:complete len:51 (+) comp40611_c0_seq100:3693-3845(+)
MKSLMTKLFATGQVTFYWRLVVVTKGVLIKLKISIYESSDVVPVNCQCLA